MMTSVWANNSFSTTKMVTKTFREPNQKVTFCKILTPPGRRRAQKEWLTLLTVMKTLGILLKSRMISTFWSRQKVLEKLTGSSLKSKLSKNIRMNLTVKAPTPIQSWTRLATFHQTGESTQIFLSSLRPGSNQMSRATFLLVPTVTDPQSWESTYKVTKMASSTLINSHHLPGIKNNQK